MASAGKKPNSNPQPTPFGIVGNSAVMQDVYRRVSQSSKVDTPVLIMGETGTGKALLANALHQLSPRANAPLITINCNSLSELQLEHQLFGHGVSSGCSELAHQGTLFIDEVHALPPKLQSRLLEFLQTGCFERPGELGVVRADVRIIAATDQDLNRLITDGEFEEDLFWRLSVLPIAVPPLRRRPDDIEPLVQHFLASYSEAHQRSIPKLDPAALKALKAYSWPGNIRELQNYIERAIVWLDSDRFTTDALPSAVVGDSKASQLAVFRPTDEQSLVREYVYHRISKSAADADDLYKQIVEPVEKELLTQVMESSQQTQTKAAARLGINRNTLYKKLVEFGLAKSSDE
jgi:DNA-binding NtrC family response regulator